MNKVIAVVVAITSVIVAGIFVKEFNSSPDLGNGFQRGGAQVVEVATVAQREIQVRAEAVGTTYAQESVEITANVTETIESIHFDDGAKVVKGDVLVVLTNNEEQAELLSAKANLAEQEREVTRLQNLVKTNSVPQSMLDERMTLKETAQHRVDAVEARLRDRIIRAPFSGVLGLRRVSPGTLVGPGTVITTLDDTDLMKLDFAVPELYLTSVTPGIEIEARSPALAGRDFRGEIVGVDSRINPVDRSIKVRAEIPNPDNIIKPGMLMNVEVLIEDRRALVVPESAVVLRGEQHFVFTVGDDIPPTARMRPITIGVRNPGVVEVLEGLEAGETVIAKGTGTVNEGTPLTIANGAPG